nr:hypothetical protein [Tanacetum cinerariifolium]
MWFCFWDKICAYDCYANVMCCLIVWFGRVRLSQYLCDCLDRMGTPTQYLCSYWSGWTHTNTAAPLENMEKSFKQGRMIAYMNEDVEVNFQVAQAKAYNLDLQHLEKVLSMQDIDEEEPAEVKEVLEIVKAAKQFIEETTKKNRIDEDVEELKRNLQILANDDDDVYTEATPLASKVPVVDYQIHYENNKPYYKIIRADETHKLFLSFIILLKNFDIEGLETLWKFVKEMFEITKPKTLSNDFLLNILRIMFEKPNIEASVWKDQKGIYGSAKQMLNNVRLKVEEGSEMSLEFPRLVRRQLNEGGVPRNVNPVNARNPTVSACYECGSTDHVMSTSPRLNRAQGPRGNHPNYVDSNTEVRVVETKGTRLGVGHSCWEQRKLARI